MEHVLFLFKMTSDETYFRGDGGGGSGELAFLLSGLGEARDK